MVDRDHVRVIPFTRDEPPDRRVLLDNRRGPKIEPPIPRRREHLESWPLVEHRPRPDHLWPRPDQIRAGTLEIAQMKLRVQFPEHIIEGARKPPVDVVAKPEPFELSAADHSA